MKNEKESVYGWNESLNMTLLEKLKTDLRLSMLNKDEVVRDAIRVIMSEFPKKITVPITLESGKKSSRPKRDDEIENDDIINVITALVKSEKQTLELKKETSSPYLEVLEQYLPQKASEEEIFSWIEKNIDFSSLQDPLRAMGPIMKHFGRKADGNQVKTILKKIASQKL